MTVGADELRSWRETAAKQAIVEFVTAVTDPGGPDFVPERDRVAVFDNDGPLWTEKPVYAQLVFAMGRAAELGHRTSLEKLQDRGVAALVELLTLTHTGVSNLLVLPGAAYGPDSVAGRVYRLAPPQLSHGVVAPYTSGEILLTNGMTRPAVTRASVGSSKCRRDCGVTVAEMEMNRMPMISCTSVSTNGRRDGMSKP